MERRWTTLIVVAALGALLMAEAALADPSSPTLLTPGASSRADLSTAALNASAQAGNVTALTIEAISITESWQGYYGNVTGTITLDDSSNFTFYNWSQASAQGEIFASRASSVTWASIRCATEGEVTTEETALGQDATDADAVNNTFSNATNHPGFDIGATPIVADDCWATNAFDNTGAQNSYYYQMLLHDGANIVYSTLLDGPQTAFNGHTADFQLLVGEDGHGNTATTPYFFFVELG